MNKSNLTDVRAVIIGILKKSEHSSDCMRGLSYTRVSYYTEWISEYLDVIPTNAVTNTEESIISNANSMLFLFSNYHIICTIIIALIIQL